MAGYVRQSAADIQAGLIVKSAIFNAEFDQLQSAFSTSGHTHDGTAGNGPKLDISNSTVGILDASRTNIPVADFVKGPAVSVDGRVAIFSGVTGKLINSSTDTLATLKNRANHTGSQAISTITGLRADLDSRTLDSTLSVVAKSGSYNDLLDKPTLGTAASQNSTAFATAAEGAKANTAVQTVNGKTGPTVSLTHTDVGAVSSTKEAEITANTTARHTHSNKTILDATTASYLAAEKTKLTGIEAGAQVNTVTSVAGKTGAVALTSSDVNLGNVANKTEAQMVSSGAIADSLDGKITGDTCEIGGFISQDAQSPYMRHKTSDEVVRLLRYDQPANGSHSVNGLQIRTGRQQVSFNSSGHASVNFTPFPNTLTGVVITSAEFTIAASYGVQPVNSGAFNLYSNSPNTTRWISWIATGA